jgi:ABC-type dipeptide/oligopeptide/nickel transport system permease component
LQQDYVMTARALGLPPRLIVFKYVAKNAVSATLTVIGLYFGWLLGGTVLVETVFDWPGIGLYATSAIVSQDFMPVIGVALVIGLLFMLVNLLVDVLYGVINPQGALLMTAIRNGPRPKALSLAWRRGLVPVPPIGLSDAGGRHGAAGAGLAVSAPGSRPIPSMSPAGSIPPTGSSRPALAHPFGTNELGQDVLSLVLAGTRVSVLAGLGVVVIGTLVGTLIGAIAGFRGGWTDEILMRLADLKLTVPGLILAMAVAAALGPGLSTWSSPSRWRGGRAMRGWCGAR